MNAEEGADPRNVEALFLQSARVIQNAKRVTVQEECERASLQALRHLSPRWESFTKEHLSAISQAIESLTEEGPRAATGEGLLQAMMRCRADAIKAKDLIDRIQLTLLRSEAFASLVQLLHAHEQTVQGAETELEKVGKVRRGLEETAAGSQPAGRTRCRGNTAIVAHPNGTSSIRPTARHSWPHQ